MTTYRLYPYRQPSDHRCPKCGASTMSILTHYLSARRWPQRPECLKQHCLMCDADWFTQTKQEGEK
jgi:hypothetical protein